MLEIETNGALAVRGPDPGRGHDLRHRAEPRRARAPAARRATESEGEIDERLDVAQSGSSSSQPEFDHKIVNDDLERALGELEGIVRAELGGAGTMPAHDPSPH